MAKVAFLGLGVMGFPMAGHLAKNGHEVTVCNRTPAKADSWVARYSGLKADTPRAAVQGASIVFSCVGDDPDLRAITVGANGAFEGMAAGSIYVDHTPPPRPTWRVNCSPWRPQKASISLTRRFRAARGGPRTAR
jgi:3-hydroxyisobutyrate dehydrogenase-like beta-hydroxyacid dehydrogenase